MPSILLPLLLASASPVSIDLQLDPTPFFLHGFAPELGLSLGPHRLYATVVGYDVPRFLREDPAFSEHRTIAALGYQYFFLGHLSGPFASVSANVVRSRFELLETGNGANTTTFKSTLRFGWALQPFSFPLFFAPWIGPVFSFGPEKPVVDGRTAERRVIAVTGALQIGWRFGL